MHISLTLGREKEGIQISEREREKFIKMLLIFKGCGKDQGAISFFYYCLQILFEARFL